MENNVKEMQILSESQLQYTSNYDLYVTGIVTLVILFKCAVSLAGQNMDKNEKKPYAYRYKLYKTTATFFLANIFFWNRELAWWISCLISFAWTF